MSKGIVDVEKYKSAMELRRPPPLPTLPTPSPLFCNPEDPACESPNMAAHRLVYSPELEENAGVILGGVVDANGATGVGMDIPGGGGMGRYGNGWNG